MVAELARRGVEAAQLTSYPELQNKLHALKALQQAHSDLEKGHSDLQQVCEELRHDKTTLQQEAEALISMACPLSYEGEHIAIELAEEQTLERLYDFSHRLDSVYKKFIQKPQPKGGA